MKILRSVKSPSQYPLWNDVRKEVTEAGAYDEIIKSVIIDEDDWDPGLLKRISENDFNFDEWQKISFCQPLIKHDDQLRLVFFNGNCHCSYKQVEI